MTDTQNASALAAANAIADLFAPGFFDDRMVEDCAKVIEEKMTAAAGSGLALIAAERQRQVEVEGWTPEHDDEHDGYELAAAAGCYALTAAMPDDMRDNMRTHGPAAPPWPWARTWWKPGADNSEASRKRELVKAGALIVAELDRLQRREG